MEFRGANYQVFVDATGPFIEVWGHRYDIGSDGKVVASGEHPPLEEPTRDNPLIGMMRDDGTVAPTDWLGRPIPQWDGQSPIYVDERGAYITIPGGEGGAFRIDVGGTAADPRWGPGMPDRVGTPAITHLLDPTGHLVPTDSQGNPLAPVDLSGLDHGQAPLTLGAVEAGGPETTAGGPTDFGQGADPAVIMQHPAPDAPPLHIGGDFSSADPSAATPGAELGALLGFNTGATVGDPGGYADPLNALFGTPEDGGHLGPADAPGVLPSDPHAGFGPTDAGPGGTSDPGAGAVDGGLTGTFENPPTTTTVEPSQTTAGTHVDAPPPDPENRAPFSC